MSALAPISVHVLIVLAAGITVAVFFILSRRGLFDSQDDE
jgi:hypothetical protein